MEAYYKENLSPCSEMKKKENQCLVGLIFNFQSNKLNN